MMTLGRVGALLHDYFGEGGALLDDYFGRVVGLPVTAKVAKLRFPGSTGVGKGLYNDVC